MFQVINNLDMIIRDRNNFLIFKQLTFVALELE